MQKTQTGPLPARCGLNRACIGSADLFQSVARASDSALLRTTAPAVGGAGRPEEAARGHRRRACGGEDRGGNRAGAAEEGREGPRRGPQPRIRPRPGEAPSGDAAGGELSLPITRLCARATCRCSFLVVHGHVALDPTPSIASFGNAHADGKYERGEGARRRGARTEGGARCG